MSLAKVNAALTRHSAQMQLPADVQAALVQAGRLRQLVRGESLFLKGSAPDALYGVVRGAFRVSVVSEEGRQAVITVLEPGHWFGEVSLLVGQERVYDTSALEDSEVVVVAAEDFHRLVASRPDIHMALTRLVCFRLRQALSWIDDAILMPLPVRLARRLLALVAGAAAPTQRLTELGVSQEDLAFMLGVSRQSVNRQLKLWESDAIVRVKYRRIELLDLHKLRLVATLAY